MKKREIAIAGLVFVFSVAALAWAEKGSGRSGSDDSGSGSINSGRGSNVDSINSGRGSINSGSASINSGGIPSAGIGTPIQGVRQEDRILGRGQDNNIVVPNAAAAGNNPLVIQGPHIRQNRGQFEDDLIVTLPNAAGGGTMQLPDIRQEDRQLGRQQDRQLGRQQDNIILSNPSGLGAVQAPDIRQEDRQLDRRQDRQLD